MKKRTMFLLASLTLLLCASCSNSDDEELLSKDAEIVGIHFESENFSSPAVYDEAAGVWNLSYTYQPSDKDTKAEFADLKVNTKVTIEVSEGATILTNLEDLDVTKPFILEVEAEDKTVTEHTVKVKSTFRSYFDFDKWTTSGTSRRPFETLDPTTFWSSSNNKILNLSMIQKWGLVEAQTGDNGSAVEITTVETRHIIYQSQNNAVVTMGLLYTGQFNALDRDKLGCYKYGIPFAARPIKVKGVYKYKSGDIYLESNDAFGKTVMGVRGEVDKPSIRAVLYEVESFDDPDFEEFATARNVKTFDKVVASAYFEGENQVEFTDFELNLELLEGKTYNPTRNYRLALIFSSSYKGDKFSGAIGSKLWIDNVELISE